MSSRFDILCVAGKPILSALADQDLILVTTFIHVLINYFPGDVAFALVSVKPVYVAICTAKEIQRGIKVYKGLAEGLAFNESSILIPILIATVKGNGAGFLAPFTRMILGAGSSNEIMRPSATTKMCMLLAVGLLFLQSNYLNIVYLSSIGVFISVKLTGIFGKPVDPFKPFENFIFSLLGKVEEDSKPKRE